MVKKEKYIIFCFQCILLFSMSAYCQGVSSTSRRESVILFTDRNMYITGEEIMFSAIVSNESDSTSTLILYCELVTPDGRKIIGGKFHLNNSKTSGSLNIPENLLTGNYFLRAYTRYMRNYGPTSFAYVLVRIINPSREEVMTENQTEPAGIPAKITSIEESGPEIRTDRTIYSSGDSINLVIDTADYNLQNAILSIVPEYSFIVKSINIIPTAGSKEKAFFYPETKGASLTGIVLDESGSPAKNIMVYLSVLGGVNEFMAMRTDNAGRFYFAMPDYTGFNDVFICTEKINEATPLILVDNDYCTLPVQISAGPFELSTEERETALKMAVNKQIETYFQDDTEAYYTAKNSDSISFYGKPDLTVYLQNYIQLPTLEEYFNELPVLVRVRKKSGHKYFRIHSNQSDIADYEPLVMVDMVAINDPDKILAINPSNIKKIEIVNSLYVKGDQVYGGIINFISQNGDFAGISLPESGIFLNYEFLKPEEKHALSFTGTVPDTRNTIFWSPADHFEKHEIIRAPETPGRYIVIFRGVDKDFSVVKRTIVFEVR
jgi:hypothetical protein